MQIHIDLSYASPAELRAFAAYVNTRAEAREEDRKRDDEEKRKFGSCVSIGTYALQQAAGPETAAENLPQAEHSAANRAATAAEVRVSEARKPKPRIVKTAETETCLDVKPNAEAQQALPLEEAKTEEPALTVDDLRRHLRTYGQANGADALANLYAEYGVKQLSELPADKYGEIIAKVSA